MNSLVGSRSAKALPDGGVALGAPQIRPGLKIRTKLLLLVLLLLVIPWMGYESVREMEKFLLAGQEQALELTTQGISSILGNRTDLFDPGVGVPEIIGKPLTSLLGEVEEPLASDAPAEIWAESRASVKRGSRLGGMLRVTIATLYTRIESRVTFCRCINTGYSDMFAARSVGA